MRVFRTLGLDFVAMVAGLLGITGTAWADSLIPIGKPDVSAGDIRITYTADEYGTGLGEFSASGIDLEVKLPSGNKYGGGTFTVQAEIDESTGKALTAAAKATLAGTTYFQSGTIGTGSTAPTDLPGDLVDFFTTTTGASPVFNFEFTQDFPGAGTGNVPANGTLYAVILNGVNITPTFSSPSSWDPGFSSSPSCTADSAVVVVPLPRALISGALLLVLAAGARVVRTRRVARLPE